ncbi:MAG: LacI family DNA-binding transcriptional regulator [Ignavibacteriales bacterium]|nr:LacI family DNA-binding transcriptional regulator [Ignavibacteriales bacterium]
MPITIYDIAREAKVGIGTVSRVFNNNPNVTIETRKKVLAVSKRLHYVPHAYAQGLARKRTNTLAAIIPFFTNYFFIEVLKGVQDKCAALGYDLILYGINHPSEVEPYLNKSIQRGRVDGILYFSMKLPVDFAKRFHGVTKPLVLVDSFDESCDSLFVENLEAAKIATGHLISLGHQNVGLIDGNMSSFPARQRLEGFKHAMAEAGLGINEKAVVISTTTKLDGFSRDAGYLAMKEMMTLGAAMPTAIVISSDVQAIGAISALRERGMKVPEDVAIVSFDDIELAVHFGLTTMRQPMYEMGELAVEKLVQRFEHPDAPPSHQTFLPRLVVRTSCGMNKPETYIENFLHTEN